MRHRCIAIVIDAGIVASAFLSASAIAAEAAPIAGLAPYQRPAGAPLIRNVTRTPEWRAKVTHGVAQPLPAGLGFLGDQGAWYNPFAHPGIPGYYDIRGWHRKAPARR